MTAKQRILVVDDEKDTRDFMARALSADYDVDTAPDAESAMRILDAPPPAGKAQIALMLSDVRMPGANGLQLLQAAKRKRPDLACILLTAFGTVDQAVDAMKEGADDFIMKPVDLDQLDIRVAKALEHHALENEVLALRSELGAQSALPGVIGESEPMAKVARLVRLAARSPATVLIQGPSGTGKELVARAVHDLSPRANGPFVAVNCGAIPESLIESELFGYMKGAFTGAVADKRGYFEAANGGTLFLDEVGELPLMMQVKLLRALESRTVQRVGGVEAVPVDIRVVAATNRDLRAAMAAGTFREDLFFRLNVVDIHLPALSERAGDIPLLVRKFIADLAPVNGGRVEGVGDDAMAMLAAYPWPGNVRELRNVVEKMLVLAPGPEITVDDIPDEIRQRQEPSSVQPGAGTLADTEKNRIFAALRETNGNRTLAARRLGISRRTIQRKLAEYEAEESTDTK